MVFVLFEAAFTVNIRDSPSWFYPSYRSYMSFFTFFFIEFIELSFLFYIVDFRL